MRKFIWGNVKNYEDEYTSAYCRLTFITWYQGYTDDVSEHLKERSMDGALKSAEINNGHKKKIYVDGNKCIDKYGKKECVQAMIDFLYFKEDYEIICASYYSLQIELSNMAYEIVAKSMALEILYQYNSLRPEKREGYLKRVIELNMKEDRD